jgi:hypothetical protein
VLVRDDVALRVVDEAGAFGGRAAVVAERERLVPARARRVDLDDALRRVLRDLADGQVVTAVVFAEPPPSASVVMAAPAPPPTTAAAATMATIRFLGMLEILSFASSPSRVPGVAMPSLRTS